MRGRFDARKRIEQKHEPFGVGRANMHSCLVFGECSVNLRATANESSQKCLKSDLLHERQQSVIWSVRCCRESGGQFALFAKGEKMQMRGVRNYARLPQGEGGRGLLYVVAAVFWDFKKLAS